MNKTWLLGAFEYCYSLVSLTMSERSLTCPGPHSQEVAGQGLRCKFSHPTSYGVSLLQTSSALGSFQVLLLVFIRLRIYVETSLQSDLGSSPTLPLNSCLDWEDDYTSLSLSFLICDSGIAPPSMHGYWKQ